MVVICKVIQCPYKSKNNFCRNKALSITQNGLCSHIYNKRGGVNENWTAAIKQEYMEKQFVETVNLKEKK